MIACPPPPPKHYNNLPPKPRRPPGGSRGQDPGALRQDQGAGCPRRQPPPDSQAVHEVPQRARRDPRVRHRHPLRQVRGPQRCSSPCVDRMDGVGGGAVMMVRQPLRQVALHRAVRCRAMTHEGWLGTSAIIGYVPCIGYKIPEVHLEDIK
jgi:hypothetical protein